MTAREIELARGLGHVPVVALERLEHVAALELARRLMKRRGLGVVVLGLRKDVVLEQGRRALAVCTDDASLDRVRELAGVTRPDRFAARGDRAPRHDELRQLVPAA